MHAYDRVMLLRFLDIVLQRQSEGRPIWEHDGKQHQNHVPVSATVFPVSQDFSANHGISILGQLM